MANGSRRWRRALARRYRRVLATRARRESARERIDRAIEREFIEGLPWHLRGIT